MKEASLLQIDEYCKNNNVTLISNELYEELVFKAAGYDVLINLLEENKRKNDEQREV